MYLYPGTSLPGRPRLDPLGIFVGSRSPPVRLPILQTEVARLGECDFLFMLRSPSPKAAK